MAVLNKTGLERLWLHIVSNLNKKVDKVEGKGLSTNDYTTEEKAKLATLDTLVGDTSVANQISTAISAIDYPVDSVNEKTGAVVLTADDVHALDVDDYHGPIKKIDSIVSVDTIEGLAIHPISYIEPVQEGEGDPSPDNVRPIRGWDKVTAQGTGKNLLYSIDKLTEKTVSGITFTPVYRPDGLLDYINVNGTCTASYWSDFDLLTATGTTKAVLPKGHAVTLHGGTSSVSLVFEGDGEMLNSNGVNRTATLKKGLGYVYLRVWAGNTAQNVKIYPMMNLGETAKAYEPLMQRTPLTADLPETVYGGTRNWTNGEQKRTKSMYQFTGNEVFTKASTRAFYSMSQNDNLQNNPWIAEIETDQNTKHIVCSHFKGTSYADVVDRCVATYKGMKGSAIGFLAPAYSDVAAFTAYLKEQYNAGTPVAIVCDVLPAYWDTLTPGEPKQLSTLKGINNVWSNCGDTEAIFNLTPVSNNLATTTISGLMSATDKTKLDSIDTGANKTVVDSALSGTSTNPVENKAVNAALAGKSDTGHTHDDRYYTETEVNTKLSGKSDTDHTHDDRYYTETEVDNKLSGKSDTGHTHSAYVNQNAFSNITVGSTTISADSATDTLTLVGSNVTITPDATNDKVTIAVADGTTSAKGIVQLTNSTSSTSTTTAATPSSVKSAYDLANTAKTNAATAQTRADSAYTLAEGKVDSLSDLGITATAAELNYVDGVTSNVQTQLNEKLPKSGGTVTGALTVSNTNGSDSNGLFINRGGGTTEQVRHYVDDNIYHLVYTNDETTNYVKFEMTATDIENGDGTNKSASVVTFSNSGNKSTITANTFNGSLSGNATSATKATQDASGNVITSTYATKTELNTAITNSKADWNQNDETAADYVKNRTHWVEEPNEPPVVLLQDYYLSSDNGSMQSNGYMSSVTTQLNDYYYTDVNANITWPVKVGDICTVIYNNKNYTCEVFDGNGIPTIGNDVNVHPTNDPFIISFWPKEYPYNGAYCMIGIYTSSIPNTNITILRGEAEKVHKLDYKFIDVEVISPDILSKLNILNGSESGSLRQVCSSVEGEYYSLGLAAVAFGLTTKAVGDFSYAQGNQTKANNDYSHAEGEYAEANGIGSHAEGYETKANGRNSHAEGFYTEANGDYSHAEGDNTNAYQLRTHAEGYYTYASGENSHAEGHHTIASGENSHAEGYYTTASGYCSHAEGGQTVASGAHSHAEGLETVANETRSHAEGNGTIASGLDQHVEGHYNIEDAADKYAHIVGNGTSSSRSNAHTLDWYGNAWFAGTVEGTALILKSSTSNSTKRFKITVNDSGTLTATEIT